MLQHVAMHILVPNTPTVGFSPEGICQAMILDGISAAQKTILVQAYEFTNPVIGNALAVAAQRGVTVKALLDPLNLYHPASMLRTLLNGGVTTLIDARHRIAHNKCIIVDDLFVLTGSYNFTPQAEFVNAENLTAVWQPDIVERYFDNWVFHEGHSTVPTPTILAAPMPPANTLGPMPSGQ